MPAMSAWDRAASGPVPCQPTAKHLAVEVHATDASSPLVLPGCVCVTTLHEAPFHLSTSGRRCALP
jgi:hypothetical protein